MKHIIEPIAYIKSPFTSKFGIPRQSGLAEVKSEIVFEKAYAALEGLRGLEDYSHLWLIWGFSENLDKGWSPTVRPPRLGGNKRIGVFATRSPFRPNGLGLSSVKIEEIKTDPKLGPVIVVSGADLMNGTPIFDIKPYISMDCHTDAVCGFQEHTRDHRLEVVIDEALLSLVEPSYRSGLLACLAQDPRPSYQDDPTRVYGFPFAGYDVRFHVDGNVLTVVEMVKLTDGLE